MLDWIMIPRSIFRELEKAGHSKADIESMSKYEYVDAWLVWQGIIGFTDAIILLVESSNKAEVK